MNAIVPQNFGAVSTRFATAPKENDLSAGVQVGFGLIGYKGKVWSTRYRGTENALMRPDGDGPMNSIEVVILKSSAHVSKIWYENGYTEGSNAAPDCFSTNGVTPDMGSKKKQATACALCTKNQWGSRITPQGKQGKACGDSKRLAIVPLPDIANEGLGGPMLLRVPAASLGDLASFGEKMQNMGYPYYSIGVRIAFDAKEAYPKFVFGAIRPLRDDEADLVLKMRDEPQVTCILAEGSETEAPQQALASPASVFEQPPQTVQQPVQQPVQTVQAAPAPTSTIVQATPQPTAAQPAPTSQATAGDFGGRAVPQQAEPAQTAAAAPATQQAAAQTAPEVAPSDFEKALDAQLDALLPAA
jgi:hypothetical protein